MNIVRKPCSIATDIYKEMNTLSVSEFLFYGQKIKQYNINRMHEKPVHNFKFKREVLWREA